MSTGSSSNKSKFLVFLLLLPFARALHGQTNGQRPTPQHLRLPQDAGCNVSTLSCGVPQEGALAAGDCLDTIGRHYDLWRIFGTAGDELTITLEPLDATFTYPILELDPPAGKTASTPSVVGDLHGSVTMKYVLTATGMWSIGVETAGGGPGLGAYRLRTFCTAGVYAGYEDCDPQPASCGQSWSWTTTPRSCSFSNNGSAYDQFEIYLDQGDTVRLLLLSHDVDPAVALYHQNGHDAVAVAFGEIDAFLELNYKVPSSGIYTIAAYDSNFSAYTQFDLDIYCNATCTPPAIASQPASQTLQGGPLALSVTTLGNAPFTYQWYEGATSDTHHPVSTDVSLQLASVPASTSYWVRVTNACGSADSSAARINVVAPGKPHVVRH